MSIKESRPNRAYEITSFRTPTTFMLCLWKASRLPWLLVRYPCRVGFLPVFIRNVILIRRWNHFHMEAMWFTTFSQGMLRWSLCVSVAKETSFIFPLLLSQLIATHFSLNTANFATMLAFSKSKWQQFVICQGCNKCLHISFGELFKRTFLWLSDFSGNGTQILNLKQIILSNCTNRSESSISKRKKQCFYLFLDPHPHLGPPPNVEHCFIVFFCILANFWWIYLHINLWPHFYFSFFLHSEILSLKV